MISIGMNAAFSVFMLDLTDTLKMGPIGIGLTFLTFALFGATGALGSEAMARRIPVGALLASGPAVGALGLVVFTAAGRIGAPTLLLVHGGAALIGLGLMLEQSLAAGLRQTLAPEEYRGRIMGTLRFIEWGSMPVGSLIGGFIGEILGLGTGLVCAAIVIASAVVPLLVTPVARMRQIPRVPSSHSRADHDAASGTSMPPRLEESRGTAEGCPGTARRRGDRI